MADSVSIYGEDTDYGYDYERGAVPCAGDDCRREAARTPIRFRDRVIELFRAPANLEYLREFFTNNTPRGPMRHYVLDTLQDAVYSYSEGEGEALDSLLSDPTARRGNERTAVGLWSEIRRLNRAFIENRRRLLVDIAPILERRAPRDAVSEDDEPYHMRMFISDSLRPPGLEHLNAPGPLYALREDQSNDSAWTPRGTGAPLMRGAAAPREAFTPRPELPAPPGNGDTDVYLYGEDDAPWSRGDANRTPEQAMAEYWGDYKTVSETTTGAPETMGRGYGETYAWGTDWKENGGSRFMRYETIPFWQKGGREGYDYDIEETLGTAGRELDGHVRRWDMDVVREPRGQEYRRYGPRSSHIV